MFAPLVDVHLLFQVSLVLLHNGPSHVLDVVFVGIELLLVSTPHGSLFPLLSHLGLLLVHPLVHLLEQVILVVLDSHCPVCESLDLLFLPFLLLPVFILLVSVHDLLDLDLLFIDNDSLVLLTDSKDLVFSLLEVLFPLGLLFVHQFDVGVHQFDSLESLPFCHFLDHLLFLLVLDHQFLSHLFLVHLLDHVVLGLLLHFVLEFLEVELVGVFLFPDVSPPPLLQVLHLFGPFDLFQLYFLLGRINLDLFPLVLDSQLSPHVVYVLLFHLHFLVLSLFFQSDLFIKVTLELLLLLLSPDLFEVFLLLEHVVVVLHDGCPLVVLVQERQIIRLPLLVHVQNLLPTLPRHHRLLLLLLVALVLIEIVELGST